MTNTYNTLNPLGSTSAKDLSDNASNFDEGMNSLSPSFYDRFKRRRETWAGMEKLVHDFLEVMGFEATHLVYVDGTPLTVLRPTQLIDRAGSVYKVKAPASFPVVLSGTWSTDQLLLVDIGDASLRSSLASATGATMIGAVLPDATTTTVQDYLSSLSANQSRVVLKEKPGIDRTADVWAAIISMRANPVSILDDIGGVTITAYSSGTIEFGRGVFRIAADQLLIFQDLGLILKGQGSRRTNNAIKAPTTLLITGASTGYGIRVQGSGARGFHLEDLDLAYEANTFAGDLLDTYNCPGTTATRTFFGTAGVTGPTRLQTARSCVRSSYDEFMRFTSCSFDGAQNGWYSDDTRAANPFGGSNTAFESCNFYDFSNKMVWHQGNKTKIGIAFRNTTFNPISLNVGSSLDMRNVEGLTIDNCHFAGSVGNYSIGGWVYVQNCKGSIRDSQFDDGTFAGTVGGQMDISNNRVYCTDGFNLIGGVVTGKGNSFSKCAKGYTTTPTIPLTINLGPDYFKPECVQSFSFAATALLSGHVAYSVDQDGSTSKFANANAQVTITNVDESPVSVTAGSRTLLITETGRCFRHSGSGACTIGLPVSQPGTRFSFAKIVGQDLTITCAGGNNFYTGTGAVKSSAFQAAANIGGGLTLEAVGSAGWSVVAQVGTWVYS